MSLWILILIYLLYGYGANIYSGGAELVLAVPGTYIWTFYHLKMSHF